ncbi:MAG: Extracellular solute-binding protein family 5, partial [Parcubacteria group bacterium Gr01-1014_107]
MSLFEKNTGSEDLLHLFGKKWKLPGEKAVSNIAKTLSLTERVVFILLIAVFAFSSLFLLWKVSQAFMVEVPERGGSLVEGIVGSPRFINPLLAETDADQDLTALVYSGLLKATPEGEPAGDLSESYSVSPDGLTYTFRLKEDIYFHDGEPVTAEDVEFTILKAQDPILKSPRRINWESVGVRVIDKEEIEFTLPHPYAPFLENATMGVLPKHLWKNLEPEQFAGSLLNAEPVGSGPYRVKKIKRGSDGLPIYYELTAFKKYASGEPYIRNLILKMFSNEKDLISAFKKGEVESINGISPQEARVFEKRKEIQLLTRPLPRIFGAFFNQNQATVFANKEVREALTISLDKEEFVEKILAGYGITINSPVPLSYLKNRNQDNRQESLSRLEGAKSIL